MTIAINGPRAACEANITIWRSIAMQAEAIGDEAGVDEAVEELDRLLEQWSALTS